METTGYFRNIMYKYLSILFNLKIYYAGSVIKKQNVYFEVLLYI